MSLVSQKALSVNNAQFAHAHSCLSFTDKAEELFSDNSKGGGWSVGWHCNSQSIRGILRIAYARAIAAEIDHQELSDDT